jgi:hypothetical protein
VATDRLCDRFRRVSGPSPDIGKSAKIDPRRSLAGSKYCTAAASCRTEKCLPFREKAEAGAMKLPRCKFLHLASGGAVVATFPRARGRKPIQTGRCASLSHSRPQGQRTLPRA